MSKTWIDVYDQQRRVWRQLQRRARRQAGVAHPETGGDRHLVHNWGNVEARQIWAECDRHSRRLAVSCRAAIQTLRTRP